MFSMQYASFQLIYYSVTDAFCIIQNTEYAIWQTMMTNSLTDERGNVNRKKGIYTAKC